MHISYKAAQSLASNITSTNQAIDNAVLEIANLTASILETCRNSEIPPSRSQPAIVEIAKGLDQMVQVRGDFIKAHRNIIKVQKDSDLQVVDFGCINLTPAQRRASQDQLKIVA